MAANKHVRHIRSAMAGKIPAYTNMLYGEIAINYTNNDEQIFIRNSYDQIRNFRTDKYNHDAFVDTSGDTMTGQLNINVATGTAPITVTSTTLCTNLNADMLDGQNLSEILSNSVASGSTLGSAYVKSTGTTSAELTVTTADTINTAFGKITKTISDNEKVTAAALNQLNKDLIYTKDVIGQSGSTYSANTASNYIINAESLNDADVILDNKIKSMETEIGLINQQIISINSLI